MTAKPAPAEWLPKRAAAEFLGISNRQLERRAYDGYIAKKFLERLPTDRSQTVVYKRADLEALKAGAPNMRAVVSKPKPAKRGINHVENHAPGHAPNGETVPGALARVGTTQMSAPADPFAGLAAHLARLGAAFPPPAPAKPWLTLAEAAEFSGLPKSWLLAIAQGGGDRTSRPPQWVRNVGTEKRASWRFSREGLAK